jgi:predicted NAD/FAD-binding protein
MQPQPSSQDAGVRGSRAQGRERVAVVGSGIAGLTAAYLLQRRFDVTLFEADARLGGHSHTHEVAGEHGRAIAVDSGFIVHNERTYPKLLRLFGELGVATQETDMSMSVRCEGCGLEYAGARGPRGLFARGGSLVRPQFLRMLGEVKRFHRDARRLLDGDGFAGGHGATRKGDAMVDGAAVDGAAVDGAVISETAISETAVHDTVVREIAVHDTVGCGAAGGAAWDPTLGEFLRERGYSVFFADHFMLPLVSAVWSTGPVLARRYPARYLFRFLAHHGMLAVTGSPRWRTVVGGSRTYVERAVKGLTAIQLSTPVQSVTRSADGVRLRDAAGELHVADRVVIATHPDQALRMLADPTPAERDVLGAIPYSRNETLLHTDSSLLPRARKAHGSWNYLLAGCSARPAPGTGAERAAVVSYHMNRLHRLDEPTDYLVTLNAPERIAPRTVLARMIYEHPIYTPESLAAQTRLPELNTQVTAYAGAYHGWGFHEDGCASGAAAAAAFGVRW